MTGPIKTVIGFDFGSDWTGVAVGQTLTGQATPLHAIRSKDWQSIEKILQDWQPQVLVVGLPLNMLGEHQQMTARAQRFARQLEGRFGIRTVLVDERLTTREAYRIALENNRKKSKTEIDCLAAALITESWLLDQKNSK
ncbi:MAG: Holliday junction resolvase RuvX [Gammaproteobacteria bacterium]|nr:MAG: Holliday junction resolvase RuvX [Gammaproteobacteria bacterium]UCH41856.1 MAG: Holliday junction resolvase RuvX [Gammaproteobacteria bacterium]